MDTDYPLAVVLEKAGYQILSYSCILQQVFDRKKKKAVPTPVIKLEIMTNKDSNLFFKKD